MTEFERAISEARAQHEQSAAEVMKRISGDTSHLYRTPTQEERVQMVRDSIGRDFPLETRRRYTYATICIKELAWRLLDAIADLTAASRADAKQEVRKIRNDKTRFYLEMRRLDTDTDAEAHVKRIADYWWEEHMRAAFDSLHYACANEVLRITSLSGNEADYAGWVLAMYHIADEVCRYDQFVKNEYQKHTPIEVTLYFTDFAQYQRENCVILLEILGIDPATTSDGIATGRKVIKTKMDTMDINEYLAQDESRVFLANAHRGCASEICSRCDQYPCKVVKRERIEIARRKI